MNDKKFPRRFTEAMRPGAYLRIVVEGEVRAGDEIRVLERPDHDVTIREVFRIYTSAHDEAERLLAVPRMSEAWKRWARDLLQQTKKDRPTEGAGPGCC
jgi:MOSC domain-containing protein YiiM